MRYLSAGIVLLGLGFAGSAHAQVSSFDTSNDGWTSIDTSFEGHIPNLTGSPSTWGASFGNPSGGGIQLGDTGQGFSAFAAPASFLGDHASLYGENLSFDLFITAADVVPSYPAVALAGENITLYFSMAPPATNIWITHIIPLVETGWTVNSPTGSAASQAQMHEVLSDVTGLYINAEWATGPDLSNLDNVMIPSPASAALLCIAGALGRRRRRE